MSRPVSFVSVARPGGGMRRLAVLDPADDQLFSAAIARVLPRVESALGPEVVANRAHVRRGCVELTSWRSARRSFRTFVHSGLTGPARSVFVGDVRDCYGSITPAAVELALRHVDSRPGDVEQISWLLQDLADRGVRGLPVGPPASAPLANVVLAGLDRALRYRGLTFVRWVDDLVVFTDGVREARRTFDTFHRELDACGLDANLAKSSVLGDRDEARARVLGPAACSSGGSPVA